MLRFLSRFSLATRVYTGFSILGIYIVSVCFAAVFAVGYVHNEYTKANNVIESTRQLSVLENRLFDLNRAMYFFVLKGTREEKAAVEEAFKIFEEKSAEVETYLDFPEVQEKYRSLLENVLEKYRADMSEEFSLYEKSIEATEKVNQLAEAASGQLHTLMEETTLPSASFVLNGLKEQFDAVLRSIDAFSVKNAESQKQLNADFLALKKAQNTAKQAEMINTKQLKKVISVLNDLEEEVNRKQKIDQTLHEKNRIISAVGDKNIQDLKELLSLMAQACTRSLSSAEAGKISLQRLFVFSAAFGGVFVILLSFLSLFGIRYPLSRLIENAREMAHGDRSVLIHFTERDDEVGALAKALAALLIRLKGTPQMPNELLGRQGMTFGSDIAYKTLSLGGDGQNEAQQTSGGEEFAYFGQGVGIDTESQLCQMLFLVQQICTSATEMTQNIKQKFSVCRECLETIRNVSENMKEKTVLIGREITENDLSVLQKTVDTLIDSFSECFSEAGEMRSLQIKQDASVEELVAQIKKMQLFLPRLTEWGRVAGELIGMIHSLSSETKILALNASIEAAKAGEKAKSFGSVSLDMRHRTHKTTEIAEQLRTHLVSIREDIMRFAEAMNNAGFRIDELYQCSRSIQPLQNGQTEHIHNSFALSESVKNMIALHIGKQNQVLSQLVDFPENAGQIALTGATVRLQTDEAEQKLEEFISSLPTYEEDKEQKIQ